MISQQLRPAPTKFSLFYKNPPLRREVSSPSSLNPPHPAAAAHLLPLPSKVRLLLLLSLLLLLLLPPFIILLESCLFSFRMLRSPLSLLGTLVLDRMGPESKNTASRCTTETVRGTHAFEIVGYSLKKGIGVGRFVRSATFTVGGYDWAIQLQLKQ